MFTAGKPATLCVVAQALVPAASALMPTPARDNVLAGGASPGLLVGRTPWSAADALVGLLAPCKMLRPLCRLRDGGVLAQRAPRPGGPPHQQRGLFVASMACATSSVNNAG